MSNPQGDFARDPVGEYTDRLRSSAPAHGGTSALDRLVYGEIPCRCNESETPPCVGCQARAEVSEMRARLAALTRENAALQESLDASRDTCASLTMDLVDERALAHDEGRGTKEEKKDAH